MLIPEIILDRFLLVIKELLDQLLQLKRYQNVLDKQYYRTQFGPNGIYPEIGRAFFVNLNAEF